MDVVHLIVMDPGSIPAKSKRKRGIRKTPQSVYAVESYSATVRLSFATLAVISSESGVADNGCELTASFVAFWSECGPAFLDSVE